MVEVSTAESKVAIKQKIHYFFVVGKLIHSAISFAYIIHISPTLFQSVFDLFPQALGLRHRHILGEIQGKLLHGHPEHRPDIVAGIHIGVLLHIGGQIRRPAVGPFQVLKGLGRLVQNLQLL